MILGVCWVIFEGLLGDFWGFCWVILGGLLGDFGGLLGDF